MDFKPALKTLGWLAILLAMLGIGIISSMGACNYGFKAVEGQAFFGWAGIANLACWGFVIYKLVKRLIKEGKI